MNIYIWFAIAVAAAVIEASTNILVAIWFAPSALVSMLLCRFGAPVSVQIAVFILLSAVLMLLFYKKLKDNIASKSEKTNTDALIGKTAIVEEDITPHSIGRVKVGGISWSACFENSELSAGKGEFVEILKIDGVKLVCAPAKTAAAPTFQNQN